MCFGSAARAFSYQTFASSVRPSLRPESDQVGNIGIVIMLERMQCDDGRGIILLLVDEIMRVMIAIDEIPFGFLHRRFFFFVAFFFARAGWCRRPASPIAIAGRSSPDRVYRRRSLVLQRDATAPISAAAQNSNSR